jgi:hypothetical protein
MKTIIKYIPVAALGVLLGTACSLDNDYTYDSTGAKDAVYFDFEKTRAKSKSLYCTFFDTPQLADSVFKIPVRIAGSRKDYDRTFAVEAVAVEEKDMPNGIMPAVAGENYTMRGEFTIAAGEGLGYVEVTLDNTDPLMVDSAFLLRVRLVASADFEVGFADDKNPKNNLNTAELRFSRHLLMPDWWNPDVARNSTSVLGQWSLVANELFRIVTGVDELSLEVGAITENLQTATRFTNMMKNPPVWVAANSAYAIDALGAAPGTGYQTYEFYAKATPEKRYRYHLDSRRGVTAWFDENGSPTIIY